VVCLSVDVGWSVAFLSRAKTAEPIEMPFGVWTWVGQRNHLLDGGTDPRARAILTGKTLSARLVAG